MDSGLGILLLTAAAFIGVLATVILLAARGRRTGETAESPFASSSEGMSTCPSCGRANLATAIDCLYCGSPLPEVKPPY
jgi:ribosomal protein L32